MQKLIFCLNNVVLNALMFGFFPFLFIIFQKRSNFLFFFGVFMFALINVW